MAKKNKIKNVVINNEELTPTVLGYLEEKSASPLFLLIVFGIFFAFLFFVPEINKYIEKLRGNDYSNNVPYVPSDNDPKYDRNDAGTEFVFSEEPSIVINEITFSDFTLDSDTLSFKVVNNSDAIVDFSQKDYYIYLKDSDGTLNDIIKLDDLVILSKGKKEYNFTIKSINISKIFIDIFKDDYIAEINLNDNKLTCYLEKETYVYTFNNNTLSNLTYTYQDYAPSDSIIYQYKKKKERFELLEGVSITMSENNGLLYEINFDLSKGDITKLNDTNMFDATYKPKVINFKMQEKGYSCS